MKVSLFMKKKEDVEVFDMLLSGLAMVPIVIRTMEEIKNDPLIIETTCFSEDILGYVKKNKVDFFIFRNESLIMQPMVDDFYSLALGEITFKLAEKDMKRVVDAFEVKRLQRKNEEYIRERKREIRKKNAKWRRIIGWILKYLKKFKN